MFLPLAFYSQHLNTCFCLVSYSPHFLLSVFASFHPEFTPVCATRQESRSLACSESVSNTVYTQACPVLGLCCQLLHTQPPSLPPGSSGTSTMPLSAPRASSGFTLRSRTSRGSKWRDALPAVAGVERSRGDGSFTVAILLTLTSQHGGPVLSLQGHTSKASPWRTVRLCSSGT